MFRLVRESVLYLKSIDVSGFKSFSRSARFEFTPGITALVGPNGSGKSNVVDAIRWCLGEQSIRDLRGQRAEDVIYAGSRQVLGAAEVVLTFAPSGDESSSSGEVTIARRLYRSGDSEYLVDGRKVRLRDLLDRLRTLGIDGSRHIVVTQGMADALLSAAPTERRSLLEQAAGLSGYRVRRDEARQKLATTEQNIATIALVLEELEPRLRALRRQARAVQDREEAQTLLRRRLHDWYAHRWASARAEADDLATDMQRIGEARRASETRLTELENATEAVFQREREWQQRVDMLVAANHGLERDRDAAERRKSETEQHLSSARRQYVAAEAREARANEAMRATDQRISEAASSLQHVEEEMARLHAEDDVFRAKMELEVGSLKKSEGELQSLQSEVAAHEGEARDERRRGEELLHRIQLGTRRRPEIDRGLGEADAVIQETERELQSVSEEEHDAALETHELGARLKSTEDEGAWWRARSSRLEIVLARTRGATADAQRRRDGAQKALGTLAAGGRGSLLHSIEVQRGWEMAIAGALGVWAHATLDGTSGLSPHEGESPGFDAWRAALTPSIGTGMWADDVVSGMPQGRVNPLRTTLLVESEPEAERLWKAVKWLPGHQVGTPGVQIVTRSGVCLNAVGRDAGRADDRAVSYLRLKRESEAMSSRFAVLSARAARLESVRDEAKVRCTEKSEEIAGLQRLLRDSRAHTAELENRRARLERQHADRLERTEALRLELRELADTERSLRASYAQWEGAKAERAVAAGELERRMGEATARVKSLRDRVSTLDRHRSEARHAHEVAATSHQSQMHLQGALQGERDRLQRELAAGDTEKSELEGTTRRLQDELAVHAEQLERLNRLLEEHSASLCAARDARPPRAASGEQVREARAEVAALVRRHERAQAEALGARERVEVLVREMADDLGVQPHELHSSEEEPPSEAEVKRLRSRALQYADADASVVEEARELGERHAYLLAHVQDLREAADTLQAMMDVADTEMRSQFDVAFAAVSEEFSRVFEVMLRGGRARLEQLDGGGIEVVAQLPGKRSRSSAAFSGGERSLIASSLLFGVLKMRPAPFCVLDEVDAALDESNVDRYLAALRDISRKTQAVVVTHNRATMAAADVLYGLTMDAEGASSVLSLRLDAQAAG